MSLTTGRGPFGSKPAGRFDFDAPEHVVYVEDFPRRVRAVVDGRTVIDSDDVVLVHETGALPHYAFPAEAVEVDADEEPQVDGYVTVAWGAAEAWFEEDERVDVHPRDPYHRIDTFSTSRQVRVTGPASRSTGRCSATRPRVRLEQADLRRGSGRMQNPTATTHDPAAGDRYRYDTFRTRDMLADLRFGPATARWSSSPAR